VLWHAPLPHRAVTHAPVLPLAAESRSGSCRRRSRALTRRHSVRAMLHPACSAGGTARTWRGAAALAVGEAVGRAPTPLARGRAAARGGGGGCGAAHEGDICGSTRECNRQHATCGMQHERGAAHEADATCTGCAQLMQHAMQHGTLQLCAADAARGDHGQRLQPGSVYRAHVDA
jgi:hypothetical protein